MDAESKRVAVIVFASLLMFVLAWAIILFVVFSRRKLVEKGKLIKQMELDKNILLFKSASEAEEREREKIARNLHDEIGMRLTVHKQVLENFSLDIQSGVFNTEGFQDEIEKLEQLRESINSCATNLVPAFLVKKGLVSTLEDQITQINQTGKVKAEFKLLSLKEQIDNFPKQEILNIYRICLELLNNILKHGKPNSLQMSLVRDKNLLQVKMTHDGLRVSNEEILRKTDSSAGLGLKSINARVMILNATIEYSKAVTSPAITLFVPYS